MSSSLAMAEEVKLLLRSADLGECLVDTGLSYVGRNENWAGRTSSGAEVFIKWMGLDGPRFQRALDFETFASPIGLDGVRTPVS